MSDVLSESNCKVILKTAYTSYSNKIRAGAAKISPFIDKTAGFLAEHYLVEIPIIRERDNKFCGNIPECLSLFVKVRPSNRFQRQYVSDVNAFEKEHECFKYLIPHLQKISLENNVSWAPQCFFTTKDIVVLENLSITGFLPKKNLLDYDHLILSIKTLAHFHSSSVIFENRKKYFDPEFNIGRNFPKCIVETVYVEDKNSIRHKWFENGIKILNSVARYLNLYTDKDLAIIEKVTTNMHLDIIETFKPDPNGVNVLQHSDIWHSNLMYKYDKNNKPIQCKIVDFQLARYAAPALELACVLYNCTTKALREAHLNEYLHEYFENFNEQLELSGLTDQLMTKEEISQQFKRYRKAACLEGFLYGMMTCLDSNVSEELLSTEAGAMQWFYGDRTSVVMKSLDECSSYRIRLTELVREFIEDFILKQYV